MPTAPSYSAIATGDLLFRLIRTGTYNPAFPAGLRLVSASMQSSEYKPKPNSQGPSVFLKDLLPNRSVSDLETENPKWKKYGIAEVPVEVIRGLGLEVNHTPDECAYATLKNAHCSITGIADGKKRDELLRAIEPYITRIPA